uniref:ABC transmembrane type-1 domain-containing protein n=1 Tax=Paramormyrops kingsleyae TaxID=1676925 RepID=A0A3B3S3Y9_9TELE
MGSLYCPPCVSLWQLTLLILACVPILSGANFIQMRATGGHASKDQNALELSGKISTETVENFRTVVSLSREEVFFQKFKDSLSYAYNIVSMIHSDVYMVYTRGAQYVDRDLLVDRKGSVGVDRMA